MDPPVAFVAMKFDGPIEKDRRYAAIKAICAEAGLLAVRADEIKTSGAVVDEVSQSLVEAELVIADSSGDSHSVSYEIGYCHGAGRPPENTLLLRKDSDIPFNYRHFRHEIYRTATDIKRILRKKLGLPLELRDGDYGYVVTLHVPQKDTGFEQTIADCFMDTVRHFKPTGRIEYYVKDSYFAFDDPTSYPPLPLFGETAVALVSRQTPQDDDSERFIRVGVGLKAGKKTPDFRWWNDFCEYFAHLATERDSRIEHANTMSELSELRAIRDDLRFEGSMQIHDGSVVRLLHPFAVRPDGVFIRALKSRAG